MITRALLLLCAGQTFLFLYDDILEEGETELVGGGDGGELGHGCGDSLGGYSIGNKEGNKEGIVRRIIASVFAARRRSIGDIIAKVDLLFR